MLILLFNEDKASKAAVIKEEYNGKDEMMLKEFMTFSEEELQW